MEDGIELFTREVELRGGSVSRVVGERALLDVVTNTGTAVRVKIRSKTRGDWRARKSDGDRSSDTSGAVAWVFVDLESRSVDFPIVPADWMARDIAQQVDQWVADDPARDPARDNHHAVRPRRIAEWCGRWDLLGLDDRPNESAATVTSGRLGAWVLKCNPKTWDIERYIAEGSDSIDSWTVVGNYRSEMFECGQRVLLWVSGPPNASIPRGFWGSGWILGPVAPSAVEEVGLWVDDEARVRARFSVPTAITLFDRAVAFAEVAGVPGLDSIEVIRAPQGSNPSWVTKQELRLLEPLLPEWPEQADEVGETITVQGGNAGFGDPKTNAVVERAAVDAVTDYYVELGYDVVDVGSQKLGWDLTCTASDTGDVHVEVKGVSGRRPTVLLTKNELRSARENENWLLVVVTRALSAPALQIYDANQALALAEPFVYRAEFPES